jgi:acetylornithine/succinyldiaminopimelate/putrescine aminotransferase
VRLRAARRKPDIDFAFPRQAPLFAPFAMIEKMITVSAAIHPAIDLEQDYLLQNYNLDFISGIGVNALGHAHPRIVRVIRQQAALLIHSSNLYYHEYQGPLAQRLARISGLNRVFFANSGTEAMEGALKMIRAHGRKTGPEKYEIISLENSFHGRTLGALSITGQSKYREDFEPLLPGIRFIPPNDQGALEQAVSNRTAGIVLEWIQGEGGVYGLPAGYAQKARELADRYDALLVFDEIQCGIGRPGAYFAYQLDDPPPLPDITVAAKPLACGLPLGAIMANGKAASAIGPGMHGTTFGGGALSCRVSLEFLDVLDELLPGIRKTGLYFRDELQELAKKHSIVREVRAFGLMVGLELEQPGKQLVLDAMAQGLLINCTHENVLRFLPPYIITEREVDAAVKVLGRVLRK